MSDHSGGCLCGAVRYVTRGALRGVSYCHCTMCRRQTGHFYAATDIADDELEIEGAGGVSWYAASPEARRGFCSTCGSALFWKAEGSSKTSVMAGSFDQPSGLAGMNHIFVADKGDYYAITDDLPQSPQGSTGT
ncbi:MAG: aldehyde-activating protein [Mesorhizobium amorphae]|nr:MAG: aldehyde-activating protein [Mesorhizobium amorphae]